MESIQKIDLDKKYCEFSKNTLALVSSERTIVEDLLEIAQEEIFGSIAKKTLVKNTSISIKKTVMEAEQTVAYWDEQNKLYNLTIWITVKHDGLISYRFRYKGSDKYYYCNTKAILKMFILLSNMSVLVPN